MLQVRLVPADSVRSLRLIDFFQCVFMVIANLPDLRETTSVPYPHCIAAVVCLDCCMPVIETLERPAAVLRGRRLEYFTVVLEYA